MKKIWASEVLNGETRDLAGELVAEFDDNEQVRITDFSCALDILALDEERFDELIVQPPKARPDLAGKEDPEALTAEVGGRIFTFLEAPSEDEEEE